MFKDIKCRPDRNSIKIKEKHSHKNISNFINFDYMDSIMKFIFQLYFVISNKLHNNQIATLKDIGAFSFLELNKGIIQMQVTIKLTR